MVIVWRLRVNIIRTALCWIVWHSVHSLQHTYVSSSYRSNRLGLSHWDPYAVRRGRCLELYYCNMVEWFWWDSSLIFDDQLVSFSALTVWFGHLACKNRPRNDLLCVEWDVKPCTYHYSTEIILKLNWNYFETDVEAKSFLKLRWNLKWSYCLWTDMIYACSKISVVLCAGKRATVLRS